MAAQAWIILTPAEASASVLLNGGGVAVDPRGIDNPLANNLGEGTLVGKFVLPARILNDAGYSRWSASLGSLPIRTMDAEVLFQPVIEGQ